MKRKIKDEDKGPSLKVLGGGGKRVHTVQASRDVDPGVGATVAVDEGDSNALPLREVVKVRGEDEERRYLLSNRRWVKRSKIVWIFSDPAKKEGATIHGI